MSLIFNWESDL